MNPDAIRHLARFALAASVMLVASTVLALPEDKEKPFEIDASSQEGTLNEDMTLRGPDSDPARVTQGSMQISGTEIRVVWKDGVIQSVSAEGNPARFQQQPEAGAEIVHISGQAMTFDNINQAVSVNNRVEYTRGGDSMTANHLDYNMETGRAGANGGTDGGRVMISLPPQKPRETTTP